MDFTGQIGEILETGQSTIKNSTKNAANDFGNSVKGQITGNQGLSSQQGTNEAGSSSKQQMSDDTAKQFLKDLYGKSDRSGGQTVGSKSSAPLGQALGIPQASDPSTGKTPEEIVQIERLRKKLHGEYYQRLTNPPKQKEEPVAQKLEREKQESQQLGDLEKQEKTKKVVLPPSAKRGTAETNPGVLG